VATPRWFPKVDAEVLLQSLAPKRAEVKVLYLTTGRGRLLKVNQPMRLQISRTKERKRLVRFKCSSIPFVGQVDGNTVGNNEWITKMTEFIANEKPDLVSRKWHHRFSYRTIRQQELTMQSGLRTKKKFQFTLRKFCAGQQTMTFHPTDYCCGTFEEQETKRKASILSCKSENPVGIYACGTWGYGNVRWRKAGVSAAEAFGSNSNGKKHLLPQIPLITFSSSTKSSGIEQK